MGVKFPKEHIRAHIFESLNLKHLHRKGTKVGENFITMTHVAESRNWKKRWQKFQVIQHNQSWLRYGSSQWKQQDETCPEMGSTYAKGSENCRNHKKQSNTVVRQWTAK